MELDAGWGRVAEIDAVLVDLDGTLLDTEPVWSAVAHAIADAHGAQWSDEDDLQIVGWSVPAVVALLVSRGVAPGGVVEALHDGVAAELAALPEPPWRDGARELLAAVRAAGLPLALVTMSPRRLTAVVAAQVQLVVAGDDVTRPKPDPEAYLRAAVALGVPPERCLVVEDSPTGAAAGLAAGAWVVAVDPAQDVGRALRLAELPLPALAARLGGVGPRGAVVPGWTPDGARAG